MFVKQPIFSLLNVTINLILFLEADFSYMSPVTDMKVQGLNNSL
jgi:hypothetical protein